MAELLSLDGDQEFRVVTPERQCDSEFLAEFDEMRAGLMWSCHWPAV